MRMVYRWILGLLLLTAFTGLLSAQPKLITYREYSQGIHKQPEISWYERTRRVERLWEDLSDGTVMKSELFISEVVLPDRERDYTKIVESGKVTETESITIGHFLYTRKNSEPWTKIDLRNSEGYGTGAGSVSGTGGSRMACSQYSVEPVVVSGTPVNLYQSIEVFSERNELIFHENRYWLGGDGLPYRREEIKGKSFPRMETWRSIVTYDYSKELKIEAPIP